MKISKLILISLMAAVACSKNESTAPSLQNAKVTTTTVQTPAGLTTAANTNAHAQEVVSYIAIANGISSYSSNFAVPASGATKSSTVIKASNGRVAATVATETYTWTDPQAGSVGLQITDEGSSYRWEYFYKSAGSTNWLKYLNAEEMKDGSSGDLEVLDFAGSDPKAIELQFNWNKVGDQYTFQWTDPFSYFLLKMNTTTKAGTIDYYEGTGVNAVISYKYNWGADGHGAWQSFDSTGTQDGSGTW
jgi:hypothetical protein